MKVLLSIRPEFALKIFDGSKKYEYRRAIFKRREVTKVVVYASAPIKKVIGEFEIEGVLHEEPQTLWAKTGEHGGITQERFLEYFENKPKGYALVIHKAKSYDPPISLHSLMVSCPPQSFVYI